MHRITLPNAFLEGENNVYLFRGEETVLIDAGYDTPEIKGELLEGFASAGINASDLDRIYLTHYHIDHCGLLEYLVAESGASVHAHPDDALLVEGDEREWDRLMKRRYRLLEEWGVPEHRLERLRDALIEGDDIYGDVNVEPISDETVIDVAGTPLRTIHTPGHSLGHLAFDLPDKNEILTGDALLPVYTPNVGGADVRVERALERYVQTLQRIAAGEYDHAWPGHRNPIDNPTVRANHIIAHHEERSLRILRLLDSHGATTPWELATRLFGDLEGVHTLHGPGEVYAHLDHLTRSGDLERDGKEYRLTAETAAELAALDGDAWPLEI
ncbi:MAG: glyoxylase-like metal-dependent hydrolase (beta-lactamase superfamily II) [Natronomonas sp.]|jgi:glyoxylase-like metal-dependent hydrolase (beta-lactamase superfamily II)